MSRPFQRTPKKPADNEPEVLKTQKITKTVDISVKEEQMEVNSSYKKPQRAPIVRKRSLNNSLDTPAKQPRGTAQTEMKSIPESLPEDIQKIMKQNQELTIMALSEQVRVALKKVQRFDRYIYSKQSEKVCYEPLKLELKRLQRIKNINKNMRSEVYDNQLTITALYNHIKLIHEMTGENKQLKQFKQMKQKEQAKKKEDEFKASLEARKNKNVRPGNQKLEEERKKLAELIDESIKEKNFDKIQKEINLFIKKFGNNENYAETIHFYESIQFLSANNIQMQNILKQIAQVLETLGIAHFDQLDISLRSFKKNAENCNQLGNKYRNHDQFHGKQMVNILSNLEKFNTNISKYLQNLKKHQKSTRQSLEISRSIAVEKDATLLQVTSKTNEVKKKAANIQVELERAKFKINQLEEIKAKHEKKEELTKRFEDKFKKIIDKVHRKIQWHADLQALKKDKQFIGDKYLGQLFSFADGIQLFFEHERGKEMHKVDTLFESLHALFKNTNLPHQKKFEQVSRFIENAGKSNIHIHSMEILKKMNLLLIAIMEYMREEAEKLNKKQINKLERSINDSISVERKRYEHLSHQVKVTKEEEVKKSRSVMKENRQIRKLMDLIDEFIENKDFEKIHKNVKQFLQKFSKEEESKDKIHIYEVLSELLSNTTEMEHILKEIATILETLSIADLKQVDACLRSLKSNHKQFIIFNKKYQNHDKFHAKQMINILHNLERFNDDIIKYLEEKKKGERNRRQSLEISRSIAVEKNLEKMQAKHKAEEAKKKVANIQVELERAKFKINELEQIKTGYETEEKTLKNFEKKFNKVLDKIRKKFQWQADFDALKKDQEFIAQKPYSLFFALQDAIEHYNQHQKSKQLQKVDALFASIDKELKKTKIPLEKRYQQISRLFENAGKKSFFSVNLYKKIDYLLITAAENVKNQMKAISKNNELTQSRSIMEREMRDSRKKNAEQSGSIQRLPKTPPRIVRSREDTPSKDDKKVDELEKRFKKIEEEKNRISEQLKEKSQLLTSYETFSNKFSGIIKKMPRNQNWQKQLELLQTDQKFSNVRFAVNMQEFLPTFATVSENQRKKEINKYKISIDNLKKILDRGQLSPEKQITQIQAIFSNAPSPIFSDIFQSLKNYLIQFAKSAQIKPPETPRKISRTQENEKERKLKELESSNRKLQQSFEKEKSKTKDLNERIKSVQKNTREKTQVQQKQNNKEIERLKAQLANKTQNKNELEKSVSEMKKQMKQLSNELTKLKSQEESFKTDITKLSDTTLNLMENRMERKIESQFNKVTIKYQQQQYKNAIVQMIKNLLKIIIENAQEKQKSEKDSRFQDLIKIIQKTSVELSRPSSVKKQWKKFFERELNKNPQISQFISLLNLFNDKIVEKGQSYEDLNEKAKHNTSLIKSLMEALRMLEREYNKRQFLNKEVTWENIRQLDIDDPLFQQLIRFLNTSSRAFRDKAAQERSKSQRLNEKMEGEMLKLNQIISQLEKNLIEKQKILQEAQKDFAELQKRSIEVPPPIDRSSMKPRKSFRSKTPQKQRNEVETLKSKIHEYAEEEKILFQKMSTLEKEKEHFQKLNRQKEIRLESMQTFKQKCRELENTVHEQARKYENQARNEEQKFMKEIRKLSELRQLALKEHEQELDKTKRSLTAEIDGLRSKLAQHQRNSHSIEEYESLRTKYHEKEQQFIKMSQEKDQIITEEVLKALKAQQADFNSFLSKRETELEKQLREYYEKVIEKSHNETQSYQKEYLSKLEKTKQKEAEDLKSYYQRKNTQLSQNQKDAREQLQKIRFENQSLNSQLSLKINELESAKSLIQQLQSSKYKEIKELRAFYDTKLRQFSQSQSTLHSQLNTVRLDHQSLTYKLNSQMRDQQQRQKEYKNKISELDEQYNRKLTQILTDNEIKVSKLNAGIEGNVIELNELRVKYDEVCRRNSQQEKTHKRELERMMGQLAEQKKYWEGKNRQNTENYESKTRNLQNRLQQAEQYRQKYVILQGKYQQLSSQLEEQSFSTKSHETRVLSRSNQSIPHVSPELTELSTRLQSYQLHLQANLSHTECQNQYRRLEEQYHDLLKQNAARIENIKSDHFSAIEKLKQINNQMRLQLKEREFGLTREREKVDKLNEQLSDKFDETKKLIQQRDILFKDKSELEREIHHLNEDLSKFRARSQETERQFERSRLVENRDSGISENRIINNRVIELEAVITNKVLQIRQLEQIIDRKKREIEDERSKNHNLERQISNLKQNFYKVQNKISSLQSTNYHLETQLKSIEFKNQALIKQINSANNQIHESHQKILELQNKESILRHDFIRVKTQSEYQNTHIATHDKQSKNLRDQIAQLKNQIKRINEAKYQNTYNHSVIQKDKLKIEEMIQVRESHKNRNFESYDEAQLEVLRRINLEVTQLVKVNRSLQTKCALLESETMILPDQANAINIFSKIQEVLDSLMSFLIDTSLIHNSQSYQRFLNASLHSFQNVELGNYFQHLENFLKAQFMTVSDLKEEEIEKKSEELEKIKEQMQDMIQKQIQFDEDQNYGALEKYKMIFTDIKYLLREFIRLGDQEYMNMICRSLGIETGK